MKLNQGLASLFALLFVVGCTQPMANSLLTSGSDVTAAPTESVEEGQLDIQPDNAAISLNIDQSDVVEITGNCKDLDRRQNRILVEVFAGDDETLDPYISNAISNKCLDTSAASVKSGIEFSTNTLDPYSLVIQTGGSYTFASVAGSGTPAYNYSVVSDTTGGASIGLTTGSFTAGPNPGSVVIRSVDSSSPAQYAYSYVTVVPSLTTPIATNNSRNCFAVTQGIGVVEDAGLPTERSFPQCHNGRFGFSVKLGKVLVNPVSGQPNQKYTVRFKLRTLTGLLSDTVWSRVTIDRSLTMPTIDSIVADQNAYSCSLSMSPARFNHNIVYNLNRSYVDALGSTGAADLFAGRNTTSTLTDDSVFSWRDDNLTTTHVPSSVQGIVAGVKYSYTLRAVDDNYNYSPSTAPTLSSSVATCEIQPPLLGASANPTPGVCYLLLKDRFNPGFVTSLVTTEWGLSTVGGWTGIAGNGTPQSIVTGSCDPTLLPTACTLASPLLVSGGTFYIAARERMGTVVGKWSNIVGCTMP